MDYKIIDIEGIGPKYAEKLQAAGIKTSADLLEKGKNVKGRKELAEATGISSKRILTWVNHTDLYRINGVGPQFAELLEASGVDTVTEFALRNPVNLAKKMLAVNEKKHLTRRVPTAAELEKMIAQAKELPRVMTYGKVNAAKPEKKAKEEKPAPAENTEPKTVCVWDDDWNSKIVGYGEYEDGTLGLKDENGNWVTIAYGWDEDEISEFEAIDEWCGYFLVKPEDSDWIMIDEYGDASFHFNGYEDEGYLYLTAWQDGDEIHIYPNGRFKFAWEEEDEDEDWYDEDEDEDWDEDDE